LALSRSLPNLSAIHTVAFDFDGVFTDNKVWVDQDGCESVRCDRGDGLAFDLVRAFQRQNKINAEFFILSKEANPVVLSRARKLQLDCRHGVRDKLGFMTEHLTTKLPDYPDRFAGLVYLGNDLNDLPLMRRAGYAVAPADAHPMVCNIAHLIMKQRGGEGLVRAFIELLLRIDHLTKEEIDELISNC
jgi:3-deoxy-D-manno-octulosonate 8-phosphate phosphatase (KDO 8-P phosphatase)